MKFPQSNLLSLVMIHFHYQEPCQAEDARGNNIPSDCRVVHVWTQKEPSRKEYNVNI